MNNSKKIKHKFVNSIDIFYQLIGETYIVSHIKKEEDRYHMILSDKTGELPGVIPVSLMPETLLSSQGKPMTIGAMVVEGDGKKSSLLAKIKEIRLALPGEYNEDDLYQGLSQEKIMLYKSIIMNSKKKVKHEEYNKLLDIALCEHNLDKLSRLPATLGRHGKYPGGALATAAMVTQFCIRTGCDYINLSNGIYMTPIKWSPLLCASMLHTFGVIGYLKGETPFQKTIEGINRGYISTLQHMLEKMIYKNDIKLNDMEISEMLNILFASVSIKTEPLAIQKEGIILKNAVNMYSELDILDAEHHKQTKEDCGDYFYNQSLKSYITA